MSQIGFVLFFAVILGSSAYLLLVNSLVKVQQANIKYIAQNQAERLNSVIENKKKIFEKIAMGEAIRTYSREYNETVLSKYFAKFMKEFPVLAYVNNDGFEEMKLVNGKRKEETVDRSKTTLFEEVTWEPNKVFTQFYAPGDDPAAAYMEFAFFRKNFFNEFEGLVVGEIPLRDLVKDIQRFKFGETGFLMLLDDHGTVLSYPQNEKFLQVVRGKKQSKEIISRIKAMKSNFGRVTILGIDGFVAYAPVKGTNWTITATLPYKEFMGAPIALKNTILVTSLVIMIAGIIVCLIMARGITNPLLKLVAVSGLIANGDLSHRVDIKLKDEIGTLAKSFNNMAAKLQETITSRDQEIIQRKQAEKVLLESEQKYRTLFEDSRDAIYITTNEGIFLDVNQAALDLFGYLKEEMLGLNCREIYVNPDERPVFQQEIEGKGSVTDYELKFRKKDGTKMDCLLTATLRRGADGSIMGYQGIIRDITHQKRLTAQLQHAQKMESLGTLAGGIAHDFNNLLMAIQGHISLILLHTDLDKAYSKHFKAIEIAIKRGADLTKQLLGFARGGKYEVKPTDLNELVETSAAMFGRTKKEIKIHKKYQKQIWPVEVDQGQIEQVLLNLYVNAWQAMPHGGNLYIETRNVAFDAIRDKGFGVASGDYVKISVTDTGIGMDEATRQKIFDPFFTTKEITHGTGLGLASAYGIIRNHGGIINVYSEKGKGSTFDIYLPASKKEVAIEKKKPGNGTILRGTETILLVDDEDMILDVAENLLKEMGYRVLLAGSGKEAVEVYEKYKDEINLVILDMIMPDMSGSQTYDRISEINPDIKVLLSSGYSINGQAARILKRGCEGFIQKPYLFQTLSHKVREILDKK